MSCEILPCVRQSQSSAACAFMHKPTHQKNRSSNQHEKPRAKRLRHGDDTFAKPEVMEVSDEPFINAVPSA